MKPFKSAATHLLPDAPPMAPRAGFWKKWRARLAGRRSAAMTVPDAQGYHPATEAMAAEVRRIEAQIHTELVKSVESVDRTIATSEVRIRLLSAFLEDNPALHFDSPTKALTAAEQAVVRTKDEAAAKRTARRAAVQYELDERKTEVAELSERREHLHTTASGILDSWSARFDELVAHHREGFVRRLTRRFPRPRLSVKDVANLPVPRYQPHQPWARGVQLPVTITRVHTDRESTLTWAHLPWDLDIK